MTDKEQCVNITSQQKGDLLNNNMEENKMDLQFSNVLATYIQKIVEAIVNFLKQYLPIGE